MNFISFLKNTQGITKGIQVKSSFLNTTILFNHDTLYAALSFFFMFCGHLFIIGRIELLYTFFFPVFFLGIVLTFVHMRVGINNILQDYVHNVTVRTIMMHLLDICYVLLALSI